MGLFGDVGSIVGPAIGGALGLVGNSATNAANAAAAQQNYEAQKEFAQYGIRWKVADAKAAGIHPLAALGAMTSGYTPSQTMFTSPDYSFVGEMGQNIGRAVDAKRTQEERAKQQVFQDQMAATQLQGQQLDNEYKRTLIDSEKQDMVMRLARSAEMAARTQGQVPAMPSLGKNGGLSGQAQYATGETKKDVSGVPTSVRGNASVQAGVPPDVRFYQGRDGTRVPLPTENAADAMDASFLSGIEWSVRNKLLPTLSNYLPFIKDSNRKPGEYYDWLYGGYRKGKRFHEKWGY